MHLFIPLITNTPLYQRNVQVISAFYTGSCVCIYIHTTSGIECRKDLYIPLIYSSIRYKRKKINAYIYIQATPVISKPDITKYPLISKWDYPPRVLNTSISIPL